MIDGIKPFSPQDIPPERALALPPSLELDMFIYSRILDGPEDALHPTRVGSLPSFSRRLSDCGPMLIMVMMELGPVNLDISPDFFHEAKAKGFMVRDRQVPTWRLESAKVGVVAYGRTFPEVLCKALIRHKLFPQDSPA